jgi:hypothetical protein
LIAAIIDQVMSGGRPSAEAEALRRATERTARATVWMSVATIMMALATAAIFALGIFQYLTLSGQLAVMQRQLDESEMLDAASITIRNFSVSGFPDNTVVDFEVVNAGKTRADKATFDPGYVWVPAADLFGFLRKEHALGSRTQPSDLGLSLEPTDEPRHFRFPIETIQAFDKFSAEVRAKLPTRDDVMSGRWASVIYIVGTYADIYGKTHHVADCLAYLGGAGFQACFAANRREP